MFSAVCTAPTATVTGIPGRRQRADRPRELGWEADDGHARRHVEAERAGRKRTVDENRSSSGRRRLLDLFVGEPAARKQCCGTGDRAHAVLAEEAGDATARDGARDRHQLGSHGVRRSAAQRKDAVEDDAQARPQVDANGGRLTSAVRRSDGERRWSSARAGDAPEDRPRPAVVTRRCDDEHVERGRPGHGASERPVGERGVRLGHADERDSGGIVRVPVVVRVDRGLEPGEQLVGARVHRVAALGIRLPAGHSDREDRSAGRDTVQASRPVRAGDDPRQLRAVALRTAADRRMRLGNAAASRRDDVDTRAGRCRADTGEIGRRPCPAARRRHRVRPDRVLPVAAPSPVWMRAGRVVERRPPGTRRAPGTRPQPRDRDRAASGRSDRAVPRTRSAPSRSDAPARSGAPLADIRLRNCSCAPRRRSRPPAHLRFARAPALGPDPCGQRGPAQDDDMPLRRRDHRAHAEDSLPPGLADRRERRRGRRRSRARRGAARLRRPSTAQRSPATQARHRRPARDSERREAAPRSGPPTRSSPHCPCRGRVGQSVPRGGLLAAPSSPPPRRRRRAARAPSARRPAGRGRRARERSRPGTTPRDRAFVARARTRRDREPHTAARS